MSNALQVIVDDIYGVREQFERVLVDRNISFEREAGFAIQVIQNNSYLEGIAKGNRQSLVDAVTNVAAIGISLNPAKKQAYLVPRDGRVCLDVSYIGLLDLAVECGAIAWAKAAVVHEKDVFGLEGYDKPPVHRFNPFAKDRGEIVGVYVVVKTPSGDYLTDTMSLDEVNAIRDRSSAWKAWITKKKSCPWVTDYSEMAKKTVVKRAAKYWPRGANGARIDQAIHHLNTDGNEGLADIQQGPVVDATPTYPQDKFDANLPAWTGLIQSGKKTADGLIAFLCSKQPLSESQKQALRDAEKTIDA
jgi:recombination protein RecT